MKGFMNSFVEFEAECDADVLSLKCAICWKSTNHRTTHSHTSQVIILQCHMLESWNQQEMTPQILLYLILTDELCAICGGVIFWPVWKLPDCTFYMVWSLLMRKKTYISKSRIIHCGTSRNILLEIYHLQTAACVGIITHKSGKPITSRLLPAINWYFTFNFISCEDVETDLIGFHSGDRILLK